jgi:hypothetical protein
MRHGNFARNIVLVVALASVPGVSAHASSRTLVGAVKPPSLIVSDVGFGDISETYARNAPSYATIWAFSVTNRSKTLTAKNVRAHLVLLNAAGVSQIDTIVTVASSIPPGRTVWAAPTMVPGDQLAPPSELVAVEASATNVASAKATIVSTFGPEQGLATLVDSRQPSKIEIHLRCSLTTPGRILEVGCW